MAENKEKISQNSQNAPNNPLNKPKNPNPNYQMWLVFTLIAIVLSVVYFSRSYSAVETSPDSFETMLNQGDISEIVVYADEKVVEITLKREVIEAQKYGSLLKQRSQASILKGPHFWFRIPSADKFVELYREPIRQQKALLRFDERSNYGAIFMQWGFLFLLIFGFWLLMRRMASGAGGGNLFNIGRSRATLFDAENKVNVTFDDVAGLDEAKEEIKEIVDFLKN
ncbi:MAG: peptidase M41, partial [Raineya sp.]|nr:peptidase M41 [Raineya sp.]